LLYASAVGRLLAAVVCAAALALVGAGRASAFTKQDLTLTMDDGMPIAATLYLPDGAAPQGGWPGIVMLHGLSGKRQDLDLIAQGFASDYAVLTFDARGHGQSGGLVSIDGPREIADTRAVHDWLAHEPGIDATRIGAWGISLGGGAVLRSLVEGVPWAAVETYETWTDLYSALAPQGLPKSGAIFQFLNSVPANRLDPSVSAIRSSALTGKNLAALRAFAGARSSRALLSKVTTPVALFQGRRDFAFDIDQALTAMKLLRGPKTLFVADIGHAPSKFPGPDQIAVARAGRDWFDRYLRGIAFSGPFAPFDAYHLSSLPWTGLVAGNNKLFATRRVAFTLRGTKTIAKAGKIVRSTARTRTKLETFGAADVRLTARLTGGWSRLVAVLTAKPRRGPEIVVSEGGVSTSGLRGTRRLTIRMISDATFIPRGSRLTLTLASNSLAQSPGNLLYLDLPMPGAARLKVGQVRLTLPVLPAAISG